MQEGKAGYCPLLSSLPTRKARVLYQHFPEKSRIFRFLFGKLNNFPELCGDITVVFPLVGAQAVGAVFDSLGIVAEIAAALVAQSIQGAIAKQAAEGLRVSAGMAGIVFALLVLEKIIMAHKASSFLCILPLPVV